jgi:hypothetical protein
MTRMRDVRMLAAGSALVLATVALAGCEPVDPTTTTTTTTVVTPETTTTTTVPDGTVTPRATPEERAAAMALLGIEPTPDVLALSDRDLVYLFSQRATWVVVKAEAIRAGDGTDAEVLRFIRTGLRDSVAAERAHDAEIERIRPERTAAAAAIGVDVQAEPVLLEQTDRDFVFELWSRAKGDRVRAAAIAAWRGSAEDQKAFITTGIFEAVRQDEQDARDAAATAARIRAEREPAAALVGLSVTDQPNLLVINDQNFVFKLWEKAAGPKVKAGASAAFLGTAADQHAFITVGIYEANRQDIKDAADAKAKAEADAKATKELNEAKIKAGAIVGWVPTEGQLLMSDASFILEIMKHADPCCPAVGGAAMEALGSDDAAVHRAFILTGIYEAHQQDLDRAARGGRP